MFSCLFRYLSRNRVNVCVNQFPNESVITVKDMLAAIASTEAAIEISGPGDAYDIIPQPDDDEEGEEADVRSEAPVPLIASWYPVTFNLHYELEQFVAYFQRRAEKIDASGEDDSTEGKDKVISLFPIPLPIFAFFETMFNWRKSLY